MISRCPNCGYSLRGLPEEYLCPECGFSYDVNCVVFAEPRNAWKGLAVLNSVILLAFAARGVLRGWSEADSLSILPFGVMMLGWLWHLSRPPKRIVISSQEIVLLKTNQERQTIAMSLVGDAHWSWTTGDIHLYGMDGEEMVTIERRFLASNARAKRAVAEIESRSRKRCQQTVSG